MKKIIVILIVAILVGVSLFLVVKYDRKVRLEKQNLEWHIRDSISSREFLLLSDQLPYNKGMLKDSVLKILPPPTRETSLLIYKGAPSNEFIDPLFDLLESEGEDTVNVNTLTWNFDREINNKNKLVIFFIKDSISNKWVVCDAVQWDTLAVRF